jgi:hypothetical protein
MTMGRAIGRAPCNDLPISACGGARVAEVAAKSRYGRVI